MPIQVREETVDFHGGREALTLLHISDIHLWYSKKILDQLTTIINQNKPDLLVFTGDYFDLPMGAHLFRQFLIETSVRYTIVFIRGNHDFLYGSGIADLLLNIPHCHCVEDSVYAFTSGRGYTYQFASWQMRKELRAGERNIALIHNPEMLKEEEMEGIDLVLAGHLHGGQFILFKTAGGNHFPGSILYYYCTDRKQVKDTTLIISKGVSDTFPFRMNCAREVVKILIT